MLVLLACYFCPWLLHYKWCNISTTKFSNVIYIFIHYYLSTQLFYPLFYLYYLSHFNIHFSYNGSNPPKSKNYTCCPRRLPTPQTCFLYPLSTQSPSHSIAPTSKFHRIGIGRNQLQCCFWIARVRRQSQSYWVQNSKAEKRKNFRECWRNFEWDY